MELLACLFFSPEGEYSCLVYFRWFAELSNGESKWCGCVFDEGEDVRMIMGALCIERKIKTGRLMREEAL